MGVTAKVVGLAELKSKLEALPTKLAKRVLRPALTDAGEIVQQAAGIKAPREHGTLTTHIVLDVMLHSDLTAEVKIGPSKTAFWGLFSEMGTAPHQETVGWSSSSIRGSEKTYTHPGEPARPWLRPAFAETTDEYMAALIRNIREGLEEVAK